MAKLKLKLDDDEKLRFEYLLKHRKLKDRCIDTLQEAKKSNELKPTDLSTAKTLNYSNIVESLITSINNEWITLDDLVQLLEEAEYAGKQHICIFTLPGANLAERKKVLELLRKPTGDKAGDLSISDFLEVPSGSTVKIVEDSSTCVSVKIVTPREYWVTNPLEKKPERELYERLRQRERSSLIVKACASRGWIQFRVPPRERSQQQETTKAVYGFITESLGKHYAIGKNSWFDKLIYFPISDAYKGIVDDDKIFELWYDTPQNKGVKIRLGRVGRPKAGNDLRKDPDWTFGNGYARTTLRGFWRCPSGDVYAHLNDDNIRLNPTSTKDLARIFIPWLCTDEDIDHVVDSIRGLI